MSLIVNKLVCNRNDHSSFFQLSGAALGLVISLCLVNCSKTTPDSTANYSKSYQPESGGTLIDAMTGEPSSLIYMVAGESASSTITASIFNKLLKYDKNLDLEGELAESWKVSEDQKTITFKLRPNLKWADGKPLTSADVLFTWQLVINDKTQSPYASDYQLVKKAEAPDAQTFSVTYDQAYAPAVDSWSGLQILPKHLLEGKNLHTTAFARHPVGSHYYKLDSWVTGENLKLSQEMQTPFWAKPILIT